MQVDSVVLDFVLGSNLKRSKERKFQVVETRSGTEEINGLWSHSRREYEIVLGTNEMNLRDALEVFWEGRRGSLYGFLLEDPVDFSTAAYGSSVADDDQPLGTGDGTETQFQMVKVFDDILRPYTWNIRRPKMDTVLIAIDENPVAEADYTVDDETGIVTFDTAPADGAVITFGCEYYIPVRFEGPLEDVIITGDVVEATKVMLVEIKV